MLFKFFLAFLFCTASLPTPIVEQPTEQAPHEVQSQIKQYEERRQVLDADAWYTLGLDYIRAKENTQAKLCIERALQMQPDLYQALVQMGFLSLWEQDESAAYDFFQQAKRLHPCDPQAIEGLRQVAKLWSKDRPEEAIVIYKECLACYPDNPDDLFYLGRLYAQTDRLEEAEKTLQECLKKAPHYTDAKLLLAQVYTRQGDSRKAVEFYNNLLEQEPNNREYRLALAKSHVSQGNYQEAAIQYEILLDQYPYEEDLAKESFYIRSFAKPGLRWEATYTDAKENDPTLGVPVVKDYYFFSALTAFIPIYNSWRIDVKPFYYHQRENDIFPPTGTNYSIYESGGQITSHVYAPHDVRWDAYARVFWTWDRPSVNFPLQNTTRFEPGTSLIYHPATQFLIVDAHVESMIIKNFSINRSQILRQIFLDGGYEVRPDVFLHPQGGGGLSRSWYQDHNCKDLQFADARIDLVTRQLQAIYHFEHSHFRFLTPNYFSYKRQILQLLGIKFSRDLRPWLHFEAFWQHSWQSTTSLIQPIGNFIFVAQHQYLVGTLLSAEASYRHKDSLEITLGGHWYRTSLIYQDWNLHGAVHWQF